MSEPTFDGWALPSGVNPGDEHTIALRGGVTLQHPAPDPALIGRITDALGAARRALTARPAADIARELGRAGARFLDDRDPIRAEALALVARTTGLSAPMAREVLDGMAADWTQARLLELLSVELGGVAAPAGFTDGLVAAPRARRRGGAVERPDDGRRTLPVGPRLCVQIVSGSVPGVGVHALLRSLLVKSPTLLKPGLGDVALTVLFARALRATHPGLADALAVVYWPGGHTAVEDVALGRAEVVVAYGSDQAVGELRRRTPVTTRFVAYHHRWSVGVVGREALGDAMVETAVEVARAAALFDQRGCVSPQVVFVEDGSGATSKGSKATRVDPRAFAETVAAALDALETTLPSGPLDPEELATLHQLRGTAEILAASEKVALWHGGPASWTVVYDEGGSLDAACPGRVLRVVPVRSLADVPARLRGVGPHLQTVGLAGLPADEATDLAEALGRIGASRVCAFRKVPFPPPWWHHDGRGPLRDLLRWVDLEV